MKNAIAAAVCLSVLALAGPASASNGLYITSNDELANAAKLSINGDGNVLSIYQAFNQGPLSNSLTLEIEGGMNGGPLGAVFSPSLSSTGLVPGQIIQSGSGNMIDMRVVGAANLFAVSQIGVGNALTASVVGNNNQSAVMQLGDGNTASFVQNGNGNMLTIVQRNW
jgi:hypothetical protein